jgi:hypothetical protein
MLIEAGKGIAYIQQRASFAVAIANLAADG